MLLTFPCPSLFKFTHEPEGGTLLSLTAPQPIGAERPESGSDWSNLMGAQNNKTQKSYNPSSQRCYTDVF